MYSDQHHVISYQCAVHAAMWQTEYVANVFLSHPFGYNFVALCRVL